MTAFLKQLENDLTNATTSNEEKAPMAESTIKTYISNIKNLYVLATGEPPSKMRSLAFLKEHEKILTSIKDKAPTTQKNYITTIMKFLNLPKYQKIYKKLYQKYEPEHTRLYNQVAKDTQTKSEKQTENWVSIDDLKEVQNKYKQDINEWIGKPKITLRQYNQLLNYLIVSLYVDIAPRRAEDYYNMLAVDKLTDAKEDDKNYYIRKERKFIFRSYKTAKTYGEQETNVPASLKSVIDLYEKYKPDNPCFIVKMNGSCFTLQPDFSRAVSLAFGKYIEDKQISINLIRNIFSTEKHSQTNKEKEDTATAMGTSVSMLDKVYTKKTK